MRRPTTVAVTVLAASLVGTGVLALSTGSASAEPRWGDRNFTFRLDGDAVPGGGDPRGTGTAHLTFDPREETLCLGVGWKRVGGSVTAMHLHQGQEGRTGDHVIEILNDAHLVGKKNVFAGCVQVQDMDGMDAADIIDDILDDPTDYYLNVHSTKYPKGAIRGQLD